MSSSPTATRSARLGAQEPASWSAPLSVPTSSGDDAVELARLAGLDLFPWQQFALRTALGERSDGKWSAFEVALLVPRQNGKGSVIEAYELANLFLFDAQLIIHSAHLFPTAQEAFRRLDGLIDATPALKAQVKSISRSHGLEGIELKNGSRIRFMARTVSGSGRGFSPDRLVLDEAFKLPPEAVAAMLPALSAQPNPQILYTSSTGYPDSEMLKRLVARGRAGGDASLAFLEWAATPTCDRDDPCQWARANPSLGYLFDEETVARERATMSECDFDRERLGLWDESSDVSAIPTAKWLQRLDEASAIASAPSFALDVSPKLTHAAIAVAGTRADGDLHGEILLREDEAELDYRSGTDWVLPALKDLATRVPGLSVSIVKGSQAESLAPAIEEAGIEVNRVPLTDLVAACGLVFKLINDGGVWHTGQPELTAAVAATKWRDVGEGGQAWGRKKSTSDIAPMFAFTLAISQAQVVYDPLDNIF
jgi:hypothetical protein